MTTSKQRIRIVTDSVCDIPPDLIARWSITVIPCFVNFGGKSYADDGVELNREIFYRDLPTTRPYPTTAAPSPGIAEEKLRTALNDADHIVAIHVPSKLSGTLNVVRLAAESVAPDRITIVDSHTLTMGIGWQVLAAAETAERTGDLAQVLEAIERTRQNQKLYAAIATMDNLKRSGRVNALVANIGTLLQIKPIVSVADSDVQSVARIRTFNKALETLLSLVRAEAPLDKLAILHISNLAGAQAFQAQLKDIAPPDTLIVEVGPTLGTHIGPGSVGAATVSKQWRQ